jgi:uncharacterized membrane protein
VGLNLRYTRHRIRRWSEFFLTLSSLLALSLIFFFYSF